MDRLMIYFILVLMVFLPLGLNADELAFPGAEGFGRFAKGGRGGRVIHVTTLSPEGPGSFKAALEASGPRIVVFDVSGIIDMTSVGGMVQIKNPYLTVAGQTAPGGGIVIKNGMFVIGVNDVIVRGVRFRVGDIPQGQPGGNRDGVNVAGRRAVDIIIDHCSVSWGIDENVGVTGNAQRVTVQYCYVTEALHCSIHKKGCHSKGLMANSSSRGNISFHHNVLAHNVDRNPQLLAPGDLECVNNVVYNFGYGGRFSNNARVHFIGNKYIPGPDTKKGRDGLTIGKRGQASSKAFVKGNVGPKRERNEGDEWAIVRASDEHLSTEHLFTSTIEPEDVDALWPGLLEKAGALPHDAVDLRVKNDILNGTGSVINSQDDVGGWPDIPEGTRPVDADYDGMSDEWERSWLSRKGWDDDLGLINPGTSLDDSHYTAIELYINGLLVQREMSGEVDTPKVSGSKER